MKKQPFSEGEIEAVKNTLGEPMFLLYSPDSPDLNNPFSAFFKFKDKKHFYKLSPLNIDPTYDDKPYLNQFDKKYTENWKLLFRLGIISTLLIILILRELRKATSFSSGRLKILITIIFIASAYMWVELVLIQKFNILLGSPVLSMGIILTLLFFFNGIGSAVTSLFAQKGRMILLSLVPVAFFVLYLIMPEVIPLLLKKTQVAKLVSAIVLVSVSGFFSGIPFPLLLSKVGEVNGRSITPLLVAFDSVLSVLAVGMLMLLSVLYGFNLLFFISLLFYSVIAVLMLTLLRR